jgi:hypothetical protein
MEELKEHIIPVQVIWGGSAVRALYSDVVYSSNETMTAYHV